MPINPLLLTAREATAFLDVKPSTLYAYVSRGLVRSVAAGGGRGRRYVKSDLALLKAQHDARAGHTAVASKALRWGEPVLDSSITSIDPSGPRYRGHLATALADQGCSFEAVAELLLTGSLPLSSPRFGAEGIGFSEGLISCLPVDSTPLSVLSLVIPALAIGDAARFGAPEAAEHARARTLMVRMATALWLCARSSQPSLARVRRSFARMLDRRSGPLPIASILAIALGARSVGEATPVIDTALVMCADHELNTSAFAARVAASSGADLYAAVIAALATLSGPNHGGACDRVEALVADVVTSDRAGKVILERTRRGEAIPGFGHRLYPKGDPRAPILLDAARAIAPKEPAVRSVVALVRAMREALHEPPTIDLGLVAVAHALGLKRGSALAIFALGRTAGWIAHALEQRAQGFLLRPRARYVDSAMAAP
ncbi:MAG: citrate synthase family protein [Polyangiales bacterium]